MSSRSKKPLNFYEKTDMSKKQEVLALTLSILRLGPVHSYYDLNCATVTFEWDVTAGSVDVSYFYLGILVYKVHALVSKCPEKDILMADLSHMEIPKRTVEETKKLSGRTIIHDLFALLGAITRKVWAHNTVTGVDTDDHCRRIY